MEQLDPAWMPFIRTDRYGEGGWVISFWAKARLLLLACTLLPLRLIAALSCVASFYITCWLTTVIPNEIFSRRLVTACGKFWSRACLFCLGFIYIRWTRPDAAAAKQAKGRSGMTYQRQAQSATYPGSPTQGMQQEPVLNDMQGQHVLNCCSASSSTRAPDSLQPC